VAVPWRAQDYGHCQLRRRARRPQLKREPLGRPGHWSYVTLRITAINGIWLHHSSGETRRLGRCAREPAAVGYVLRAPGWPRSRLRPHCGRPCRMAGHPPWSRCRCWAWRSSSMAGRQTQAAHCTDPGDASGCRRRRLRGRVVLWRRCSDREAVEWSVGSGCGRSLVSRSTTGPVGTFTQATGCVCLTSA